MIFYLKGHDRVAPISQLLICLYPDEEHVQGRGEARQGEYVVSSLIERDGVLIAGAEGYWGDIVELQCPGLSRESHEIGEYLRRAMYLLLVKRLPEPPQWGMLTGVKPSKLVLNMMDRGLGRAQIEQKLRSDYFVAERRVRMCLETAEISKKLRDDTGCKDIELYIGIPFCPAKCSYCSFVSNDVRKWGELVAPYVDTLLFEIEGLGRVLRETGRSVRSIYIGGGTPSILTAEQLDRLLGHIDKHIDRSRCGELTLEAGRPETTTREKLLVAKAHGVGRISVNPQTMNDAVLKGVGRLHTAQDVIDCYNMARRTGDFEINMDLIAGLPGDDDESLINSVRQVTALAPDNITLHSLARKRGAPLRFGKTGELSHETMDRCHEIIQQASYCFYYLYRQKYSAGGLENAGFARDGKICRYNVIMMEETGSVAAAGSGGVSKLVYPGGRIERITNPKYPIDYIGRRDIIESNLAKLAAALEKD